MSAKPSQHDAQSLGIITLRVILALIFLGAGIAKLAGMAFMVALFNAVGIGQWFRFAVGTIEVVGALCLFTPSLVGAGALLLSVVMLGAIVTQGFIIKASPVAPLVVFVMLVMLAWACRAHTASSLARLRSVFRR